LGPSGLQRVCDFLQSHAIICLQQGLQNTAREYILSVTKTLHI